MTPRLASEIWVAAYLTRLRLANIPAYVITRGDATSGVVLVKLATLDGQARVFEPRFDFSENRRVWAILIAGAEPDVDAALTRARTRDSDLWVIEIEDRAGRSLLEEDGLT
ncbi:MAG: DUF1491 family protein [Microgenomates group bacterium]